MVYESDYSTRRVYSSAGSRPGIATSYSYSPGPVVGIQNPITPFASQLIYIPCNAPAIQYAAAPAPIQLFPGGAYSRVVPHIAHQRLVAVSPPSRGLSPVRVQQMYDELEQDRVGAFGGGLNYIIVKVAPTPPPRRRPLSLSKISYIEDVTDHNNIQTLARETRLMRRDADNLLIRLNEGLPPPVFSLRSIPLRSSNDLREAIDIRRRYVHERNNPHIPYSDVRSNIYRMSMYDEPEKLILRGAGNLACLSYAGGRPIPKRRRFYPEDKIRDDVNFRSYYFKLRDAAAYGRQYIKQIYQPLYRSKKSILGLSDEPKERKEYESKWVTRALAKPDGPAPPPRKSSGVATSGSVKSKVAPRQEVDVTLPGPRKSVNERPEIKPKVENVPEEKVVVKIPREEREAPVPVEAKAEKTVKVPATPPQPEPEVVSAPEPEPAPEPPAKPIEEPQTEVVEPVVEAPAPAPEPEPVPAEVPAKEEPAAEPSPAPETVAPEKAEPEPAPVPEPPAPAEPAPVAEVAPVAEATPSTAPAADAASAEVPEAAPVAEAPVAETGATATETPEDTSNKGEQGIDIVEIEDHGVTEDVDINEEINEINEEVTMDEVCGKEIEENDLEIANSSPVQQEGDTAEQHDTESNEQPELVSEPEPIPEPELVSEPEQVHEPEQVSEPELVSEPEQVPEPECVPELEIAELEPEPEIVPSSNDDETITAGVRQMLNDEEQSSQDC